MHANAEFVWALAMVLMHSSLTREQWKNVYFDIPKNKTHPPQKVGTH